MYCFHLLIFCSICAQIYCFFSFKKTEEEYQTVPTLIKGVPTHLEEKYSQNEFICDGSLIHNSSIINDGFCDCFDGSDEPGTSACSYTESSSLSFHCNNVGYKITKIPTSRVDDGICDCCDGSDEGTITQCPNNCKAMADREREQLEHAKFVYTKGNAKRLELEEKIRNELTFKTTDIESYKFQLENISKEVENLKVSQEEQKHIIERDLETFKNSVNDEIINVQSKSIFSDLQMLDYASILLNLLSIDEDAVLNILKKMNEQGANIPVLDIPHNQETHIENHHDEYEDDVPSDEGEAISNDEEVSITSAEELDLTSCLLYQLGSKDMRLKHLCGSGLSIGHIGQFVFWGIYPQYKPFDAVQLLMGYFHVYNTLDNAEEFVKGILHPDNESISGVDSAPINTCPSEFESAPAGICETKEYLYNLYDALNKEFHNFNPSHEHLKLYYDITSKVNELEMKKKDLQTKVSTAEEAQRELLNPHLALLGYKDVALSVEDGGYTYSVHIMQKATQQDKSNSNVNLGNYDKSEEMENGDIIMKFTDGQYCWNHGARAADVHVVCGVENKLLSVREPSTCYYLFELESPVACTKKFAETNGIQT